MTTEDDPRFSELAKLIGQLGENGQRLADVQTAALEKLSEALVAIQDLQERIARLEQG